MVSGIGLWIEQPGSSPGRVIVLCSWARHLTLTLPLSTQEYVGTSELSGQLDKNAGGLPVMDYHPIQGSSDTPSRFMLWKPELNAGLISH